MTVTGQDQARVLIVFPTSLPRHSPLSSPQPSLGTSKASVFLPRDSVTALTQSGTLPAVQGQLAFCHPCILQVGLALCLLLDSSGAVSVCGISTLLSFYGSRRGEAH